MYKEICLTIIIYYLHSAYCKVKKKKKEEEISHKEKRFNTLIRYL